MRLSRLTISALVALGVAFAILATSAVVHAGRDSVVRRARGTAQRLEANDVIVHDYDVPDPVVATFGTVVDDEPAAAREVAAVTPSVSDLPVPDGRALHAGTRVARAGSQFEPYTPGRAPPSAL